MRRFAAASFAARAISFNCLLCSCADSAALRSDLAFAKKGNRYIAKLVG